MPSPTNLCPDQGHISNYMTLTKGIGEFSKGNESEPFRIPIEAISCYCGKRWWARIKGGKDWVDATLGE